MNKILNPEDSWAQVELYRWQHGQLPPLDGTSKTLDESAALLAMADAIENGRKTQNREAMPSPFNVCAVMRYVARKISSANAERMHRTKTSDMKTPNTNTNEAQEPASAGCHDAACSPSFLCDNISEPSSKGQDTTGVICGDSWFDSTAALPTPETDDATQLIAESLHHYRAMVDAEVCKKMERQRNQAQTLNIALHMRIRKLERAIRQMDRDHSILPENRGI